MTITREEAFLRVSAIFAFLSAITTFLLWLLPKLYNAPSNFEEGVLLRNNSSYLARLWVNFIHIPIALTSYFGLTILLFRKRQSLSVFGMLWFVIWGIVEMVGISIIIFSVNFDWRTNFTIADAAQRGIFKANIEAFYSIWDSMFFVLLVAFLIGSFCFSMVTWTGKGIEKILSYLLWLSVPLTILIILSNYVNQEWAGQITNYIYPVLQPVSRAIMGVFLWKNSDKIKTTPILN